MMSAPAAMPACAPAPPPHDDELPPRLRCEGGQLIKPNGNPIFLKGVSFGAWGEDVAENAYDVSTMHGNLIRFALRWWTPKRENDSRDNDGFGFLLRANVERWVNQIATATSIPNMWAAPMIDTDCGQNGTQDAATMAFCDPHGTFGAKGRNFYHDASMRRLFATVVWPTVAARLRTMARIAFIEIHPEPADGRGPEYRPLVSQVQRECIDAIRGVDKDTPFLIGARGGYDINFCDEAFLEERQDCVYTGNLLSQWVTNPDKFDDGLAKLLRMRDERGVPIFCQQMGRKTGDDRDLAHMRRAVERMRAEDVGYAWWQWRQNTSNPDEYALNYKTPDGRGWVQKDNEVALLTEAWA